MIRSARTKRRMFAVVITGLGFLLLPVRVAAAASLERPRQACPTESTAPSR